MACEAKKSIIGNSILNESSILFISDWSSNKNDILENLIFVSLTDLNHYDIVSLMTEQPVKDS